MPHTNELYTSGKLVSERFDPSSKMKTIVQLVVLIVIDEDNKIVVLIDYVIVHISLSDILWSIFLNTVCEMQFPIQQI